MTTDRFVVVCATLRSRQRPKSGVIGALEAKRIFE